MLLRHGNILKIILFLLKEKTLQKPLKTIHNIDIKYEIAYFRILKKINKWINKKNEKKKIEKGKNGKSKTRKP